MEGKKISQAEVGTPGLHSALWLQEGGIDDDSLQKRILLQVSGGGVQACLEEKLRETADLREGEEERVT